MIWEQQRQGWMMSFYKVAFKMESVHWPFFKVKGSFPPHPNNPNHIFITFFNVFFIFLSFQLTLSDYLSFYLLLLIFRISCTPYGSFSESHLLILLCVLIKFAFAPCSYAYIPLHRRRYHLPLDLNIYSTGHLSIHLFIPFFFFFFFFSSASVQNESRTHVGAGGNA